MKMLKMLFAAAAAVMMTLSAQAANTAKAVLDDGGKTLRFVYDNLDYGPKGTNWFSVAEAEAIDPISDSVPWEELGDSVTKVVFNSSFAGYRPVQCGSWFYNFEWLSQIEGIGNLKTSSATGMAYMFSGCSSLTSLDLSGFDTAQVTSMNSMFSNCSSLKSLNLSSFDTAKVTDMHSIFYGCSSLREIVASNKFVTTAVTSSEDMFDGCTSLKGGAGTVYAADKTDVTYARIDGGASSPGYFCLARVAKVVVEDGGTTLRFVYDDLGYGEKDVDWFSVKDAEAIVEPADEDVPWVARGGTVTKVVFDKSFADYRPSQCGCWFWNFGKLATIDGVKNLDTSSAKSLAYMFGKCSKLVSLDLSGFDTSKVTNMDGMFRDCTSLTTIYASEKFVTAQVTQSSGVFYQCDSLVGGNGTPFDSGSIAYARIDAPGEPGYFTAVPLIAKVVVEDDGATLRFVYDNSDHGEKDVDWFSVAEAEAKNPSVNPAWHDLAGSVTKVVFDRSFADYRPAHCGNWFNGFGNLEKINGLKNLDTSDATSMIAMFYGCSSLTSLDLSTFDTSEVTSMNQMFEECSSLVSLNLTGFDTAKVTGMGYVFCNCSSLATIYASDSFVTTAVSFPVGMFTGCTALKGGEGTMYDASVYGTAYARIDGGASSPGYFTLLPKSAKVLLEDFGKTLRFVYDGLSHGDEGTDWFSIDETGSPTVNPPWWPVHSLEVNKVIFDPSFASYRPVHCGSWFSGFLQLKTVENLENLDTSEATSLTYMFWSCVSLESLDLTGFDTSQVTSMASMFSGCSSLKSIAVSGSFVTTAVTASDGMFYNCTSLKGGAGTTFDSTKTDATYARIDGGPSAPGYFTLKPVGGYAVWAAEKGLTGADAAWDAKPALWGGTWENGFIYTFGEGLADGTLVIMNISFDADGKPVITTTPVIEGHTDFTPAVIGTANLQNWSSPVMLENKSVEDWTLPAGAEANFFRVRLSE